jgi:hypothetical protein
VTKVNNEDLDDNDNFDEDEDAYYLGGSEPIVSGRPMNRNHAMYLEKINFANESNSQRPVSHQIVGVLTKDGEKSSIASDGSLNDTSGGEPSTGSIYG